MNAASMKIGEPPPKGMWFPKDKNGYHWRIDGQESLIIDCRTGLIVDTGNPQDMYRKYRLLSGLSPLPAKPQEPPDKAKERAESQWEEYVCQPAATLGHWYVQRKDGKNDPYLVHYREGCDIEGGNGCYDALMHPRRKCKHYHILRKLLENPTEADKRHLLMLELTEEYE